MIMRVLGLRRARRRLMLRRFFEAAHAEASRLRPHRAWGERPADPSAPARA